MVVSKVIGEDEFKKILIKKLRSNFTEIEIHEILKLLTNKENKLKIIFNKNKQDRV